VKFTCSWSSAAQRLSALGSHYHELGLALLVSLPHEPDEVLPVMLEFEDRTTSAPRAIAWTFEVTYRSLQCS
jgi:hypothetical protein